MLRLRPPRRRLARCIVRYRCADAPLAAIGAITAGAVATGAGADAARRSGIVAGRRTALRASLKAPASAGAVVGLTAAVDHLADLLLRLRVRVVRRGLQTAGLFRDLGAQFGAGLRREQHSEPGPEHGPGEQTHQKGSA